MVRVKEQQFLHHDESFDIEPWLKHISSRRNSEDVYLIRNASLLSQLAGFDHATETGQSCFMLGLAMVDILVDLEVDKETLAAALIYETVHYAELTYDDVGQGSFKTC